jgi:hypothetical protein
MKTRFSGNICGYENTTYRISIAYYYEPGLLNRYSDGLRAGRPGFDSLQGKEIFSLLHCVHIGSGAHPAYEMGTGGFFPGVKRPGRYLTTHFLLEPRSRMVELYLHSPYVFMAWSLIKPRDNFTFVTR